MSGCDAPGCKLFGGLLGHTHHPWHHEQAEFQKKKTQFLVCIRCGEAFDSITPAHEHGTADLSGSAGWCGDEGFNIVPESEAF